jgi:DNA-directed RNA polymerase specialized sigma24 family protein
MLCQSPSPEDLHFNALDAFEEARRYERRLETMRLILDKFSNVQRRRYVMYHVDGLTVREIADIEGISHVAVVYSLELADKKIKKVLTSSKK